MAEALVRRGRAAEAGGWEIDLNHGFDGRDSSGGGAGLIERASAAAAHRQYQERCLRLPFALGTICKSALSSQEQSHLALKTEQRFSVRNDLLPMSGNP